MILRHYFPSPIQEDIVLDAQTAPFFAPKYHTGPVETLFHLFCHSVRNRVFAGRTARMITGERVLLLQQVKTIYSGPTADEKTVFVGDATLLHCFDNAPTAPHVIKFWQELSCAAPQGSSSTFKERERLRLLQLALVAAHPLPIYSGRIARCHKPQASSLGTLIWDNNEASLLHFQSSRHAHRVSSESCGATPVNSGEIRELRFDLTNQREWISRVVEPLEVTHIRQTLVKSLVDQAEPLFEKRIEALSRNPKSNLHHVLKFYGLTEQQQCLRILQCNQITKAKILKELNSMFLDYLLDLGVAVQEERHVWRPLVQSLSYQTDLGGRLHTSPLPPKLNIRRAESCRELGWSLATTKRGHDGEDAKLGRIGFEWASQFTLEAKRPMSAHEQGELAISLNEIAN